MMSAIIKAASRLATLQKLVAPIKTTLTKREFTRNLWYMCNKSHSITSQITTRRITENLSLTCNCGCNSRYTHSKGERELVEFLTEEIIVEKKAQKLKVVPENFEGFKVKLDNADVEMIKETDKEKIVISFNVNHTVDSDEEAEVDPSADKVNLAEMKSKPQFEVDIVKGDTTLSFTCSFQQSNLNEGDYNDVFGIDEITMFKGEWNDKVYAVAGDVLDGYLYDLLMNLLEEKGITNEFVEKLSEFSTTYEHINYINLLEGLSKFTIGAKV